MRRRGSGGSESSLKGGLCRAPDLSFLLAAPPDIEVKAEKSGFDARFFLFVDVQYTGVVSGVSTPKEGVKA